MNVDQENGDIADIYERMLKGDRTALSHLQQVEKKKSPPKDTAKLPPILEKNIQHSPNKTQPKLTQMRKSENIKGALQEKVKELRTHKPDQKIKMKSVEKISDAVQYQEPKPFAKNKKKIEGPQTEKLISKQAPKQKPVNVSIPKPKLKTTSQNFQMKINKNKIKDSNTEKQTSSPPSSKNSFRVKNNLGSKKLIQELLKINEEERKMQAQILQLHNNSKDRITGIVNQYRIKIPSEKYSNIQVPTKQSSQDKELLSPLQFLKDQSPKIKTEEQKLDKIMEEIKQMDKDLERHRHQISKKEAKIEMSPLLVHLNTVPDIFEERESEEENDVDQLPKPHQINMDPKRTYQSTMNQIRKKNWGLQQRIGYEYETVHNQSKMHESPKKNIFARSPEKIDNGQNRVTVNSRLKQFLFD